MKLPDGIDTYLAQLGAETPTTLAQFDAALAAFQRACSGLGARLSLELAELEVVHAAAEAEVIRANTALNTANATGDAMARVAADADLTPARRAHHVVDMAVQRSTSLRNALHEASGKLRTIRNILTELTHDQAAIVEASKSA